MYAIKPPLCGCIVTWVRLSDVLTKHFFAVWLVGGCIPNGVSAPAAKTYFTNTIHRTLNVTTQFHKLTHKLLERIK